MPWWVARSSNVGRGIRAAIATSLVTPSLQYAVYLFVSYTHGCMLLFSTTLSKIPRTEPERLELLKNAVNGYWIKDFTDPEFYYSELARNIAAIQKDDASDEEKKQFTKDQEAHWREVIPIEYRYPWDEVEQKQ